MQTWLFIVICSQLLSGVCNQLDSNQRHRERPGPALGAGEIYRYSMVAQMGLDNEPSQPGYNKLSACAISVRSNAPGALMNYNFKAPSPHERDWGMQPPGVEPGTFPMFIFRSNYLHVT